MKISPLSRIGLCCVLVVVCGIGRVGLAATPKEVDDALTKGKAFIYSQINKDGNWEPKPKGGDNRDFGGYTAIAVYALLASGESYQEKRIAKAIEFLEKEDLVGTYAVGLRCQIWNLVHMNPAVKAAGTAMADC